MTLARLDRSHIPIPCHRVAEEIHALQDEDPIEMRCRMRIPSGCDAGLAGITYGTSPAQEVFAVPELLGSPYSSAGVPVWVH